MMKKTLAFLFYQKIICSSSQTSNLDASMYICIQIYFVRMSHLGTTVLVHVQWSVAKITKIYVSGPQVKKAKLKYSRLFM